MMATVCIQMGHVARASGKTGTSGEQDFARLAAAHAAGRLGEWYGHQVRVIGADDPVPKTDFFFSIHCDGSTSRSARGASIGYQDARGETLGGQFKQAYARLGWPTFRADNYTEALRGYYGVARARKAGTRYATIIEAGFLTSPEDRALLVTPDESGAARVAQAICDAVGAVMGHPRQPDDAPPPPDPVDPDPPDWREAVIFDPGGHTLDHRAALMIGAANVLKVLTTADRDTVGTAYLVGLAGRTADRNLYRDVNTEAVGSTRLDTLAQAAALATRLLQERVV
jgi:hypothetical protein